MSNPPRYNTFQIDPNLVVSEAEKDKNASALSVQVAGSHYKGLVIQPVEYIHANKIPFIEGCIIKYATRWREKGGVKDLEKIIHFTQLLIELEAREASKTMKPETK